MANREKSESRQIVDQLVGIGGRCLNTGRAKHGRADARANCLRGQSSTQRNGGKISVIKGERNNQSLNCLYTSTHLGYGTERIGRDTKNPLPMKPVVKVEEPAVKASMPPPPSAGA